jgi:hypothetical protein
MAQVEHLPTYKAGRHRRVPKTPNDRQSDRRRETLLKPVLLNASENPWTARVRGAVANPLRR